MHGSKRFLCEKCGGFLCEIKFCGITEGAAGMFEVKVQCRVKKCRRWRTIEGVMQGVDAASKGDKKNG